MSTRCRDKRDRRRRRASVQPWVQFFKAMILLCKYVHLCCGEEWDGEPSNEAKVCGRVSAKVADLWGREGCCPNAHKLSTAISTGMDWAQEV